MASRTSSLHIDNSGHVKLAGRHWFDLYKSTLNIGSIVHSIVVREIIIVREGLFRYSNSRFSTNDAEACTPLFACSALTLCVCVCV